MEKIKIIGKNIGIFLIWLFIGSFLLSIMYYLFFSKNIINILSLIYMSFVFLFLGFQKGKKATKKGYLVGLKQGLINILILFIFNIIFYHSFFKLYLLFYYLILIAFSITGAMIGINKKKD